MANPRTGITRRGFLQQGVAAAGVGLSAGYASAAAVGGAGPRMAVIGVRGRGKSHLRAFASQTVALCDVDASVLAKRAGQLHESHGRRPATFRDYRELLDREDIQAVSIATPNHTHTPIAIAAMRAGKDVYVEKPVSHNVWEGEQLVAWAQKTGRVVQCGTQARSSAAIQQAVAWVRAGELGAVKFAVGTCYKPRKSIGKLAEPLSIPSDIDYDLWCGPADQEPLYRPNLHYDWHWDYNTGAGDMGNQGIHQMDIARWFLGEDRLPPRVLSLGARLGYDDSGETANTQLVYCDYPKAPLLFDTRGLPSSKAGRANWGASMDRYRGSQIGVIVQCEGGHLHAPSTYDVVTAYDTSGRLIKEFNGGGNHYANFLSAVAANDPARVNGSVADGHLSSALCHLGNVSHQLGEAATTDRLRSATESNELLGAAFNRMADHLRANEIDIDGRAAIVQGEWVSLNPETATIDAPAAANPLWKREGRAGHRIPIA